MTGNGQDSPGLVAVYWRPPAGPRIHQGDLMRRAVRSSFLSAALALALGCGGSDQSGGATPGTGGSSAIGGSAATGGSPGDNTGGAGGVASGGGGSGPSPATGGSSGGAPDGGAPPPGDGGGSTGVDGGAVTPPGGGTLGDPATCDFVDQKQFCACIHATCGGDTFKDKGGTLRSVYCG